MRIIGGQWKGRRIQLPSKKWPVRPTTDFAREALFNILDNRVQYESISVLDLFGGTGMHTLELASRGCNDITYVDRYKESAAFMKEMSVEWNIPVLVVQSDVLSFLKNTSRQWDYVFADPPYDLKNQEEIITLICKGNKLTENGFFVLEHIIKNHFDHLPGFKESRTYGQSVFSFFNKVA